MMTINKAQKVLDKEKKIVARQEKYLNSIVWIAAVVFILFGGILYYWLATDYKLFTFNKVTVQDKPVRPGEAIIFEYDYCKHVDAPVKIVSKLVGSHLVYERPVMENPQKKGCYKMPVPVLILPDRQPDSYHFNYQLCAKVNPLREVCEEHNSPEFKVATDEGQVK